MDLQFTPEEKAFRMEVRNFIRDNLPKATRERMRLGYTATKPQIVEWLKILNARGGWSVPGWPKEWGGPGWTTVQKMIFTEEVYMGPAPEPLSFNSTMIGPVLMQFGTDKQKKHYLPRAANMDDWWCQGFSEPGAGSDLASLKTAAKRDGDFYVVNGQKIWTSTAHNADMCFCLVRTNPNAAKRQEGISFLLIDMKTPGIEVRPIITMDGSHHVNEVFFTDVRVPVENLVHVENKGWDVAKFLLSNERNGIARLGRSMERLDRAIELARDVRSGGKPLIQDQAFRERVAKLQVELKALEITQLRVVDRVNKASDGKPDPGSSVLKIKGSEIYQEATEMAKDVAGPLAMAIWAKDLDTMSNEPEMTPEWAAPLAPTYLMSRAASIYGGSNEIQKNILSKRVMGF